MNKFKLGIDIGSTTVKIAVLDDNNNILFSDYERHFANIQETLQSLLEKAVAELGEFEVYPVITGSGGLTLAKHLEVPFTQEQLANQLYACLGIMPTLKEIPNKTVSELRSMSADGERLYLPYAGVSANNK